MDWSIRSIPAHGPLFEGAIAVYGEAFGHDVEAIVASLKVSFQAVMQEVIA